MLAIFIKQKEKIHRIVHYFLRIEKNIVADLDNDVSLF